MLLVGMTEAENRQRTISAKRGDAGGPHATVAEGARLSRDVAAIVGKYGGRLDVLANGARVVSRSAAGSAADDAASIARCALALRAVLPDAPMAIAMGRSEDAADAPSGVRVREGSVIERGTQLLDVAAQVGAHPLIRVDDVAGALLALRFDLHRDEHGFVLHNERESVEPARKILGRRAPCLGRDAELGVLAALLGQCVDESSARAVIVTGHAGIGKTRLMQEFLSRAQARDERCEIWITHGDEINAGSPFGMLARALRRASGLRGDESLEVQQRALGDRIAAVVTGADTRSVQFFLGEVCGVPFPVDDEPAFRAVRDDPGRLVAHAQWAFEKLVAAECQRHPLALVLEDLHWGDLPSVRMLDAALRALADKPLFVLALARPEVHDVFPKLWNARSPQVLSLGELSKKVSERLVKDLLGDRADSATTASLVDRAAGNPFFLEELIRAVAERGRDEIPDSVLAVVQARLEAIEPEGRRVLRAASLFGQSFSRRGIEALLKQGAEEWLAELVRREVIVPLREGSSGPADEHRFCHALVHQAAYAMLTEANRRLGHRLAGEWLEESGVRDAILLASHFERAGERARAGAFYARAAEDALRGGDITGAAGRAARGIESGIDGDALGCARWIAAEASRQLGDQRAAAEHIAEAMRLLPAGTPRWYQAQRTAVHVGMSSLYGKMM
jgi:hypothetical protein